LEGAAQRLFLTELDRVACGLDATREQLVLAVASPSDARAFERERGVNPREALGPLLELLQRPGVQSLLDVLGAGG
jgi:hypothetical protein